MPTALIRKLECFTLLSADDKAAIQRAVGSRIRRLGPREDVIREGEPPHHVNLIVQGWACRYKVLEDGRRQIVAFFLPGDLCDLKVFLLQSMDHSIASISALVLSEIPRDAVLDLTERWPRVARALWWSTLVSEATEREWIVNIGQRTALERLGHLFCELRARLEAVGLVERDGSFEFPLTQAELAETTGLSTVHVNRTLQELRAARLISLRNKRLRILDPDALCEVSLFNPNYLHLDREGREFDANER